MILFPNPCKITSHDHASPETSNLLSITDSLQPNCHFGPTGHGMNQPVHQTANRHGLFADDILHGKHASLSLLYLLRIAPADRFLAVPYFRFIPIALPANQNCRRPPVTPRPLKIIPDSLHVANLLLSRWPLGLQGKFPEQCRQGKGVSTRYRKIRRQEVPPAIKTLASVSTFSTSTQRFEIQEHRTCCDPSGGTC